MLEPFRDDVVVYSGLAQVTGRALGDGPGDHARATATLLTGVHPYKTGGADFKLGISADQIAALEFGKQTQLASLELALEQPALAGNCDSGYTCAYMSMSWRGETSPLPGEINPRTVFERLFGDGESTEPTARMARLESQKSVLDYVTSSLTRLQGSLGAGDKRKLDEYLEAVRDIERRIQRAEEQNVTMKLPHMERPSSIPDDYEVYCKLMMDMQVIAWQTDMTRVTSFTMGRDGSNRAVSRNRHLRRSSLDFASPAGSGARREAGQDRRAAHADVRVPACRSCTTRTTATARCSITRSRSSAAA